AAQRRRLLAARQRMPKAAENRLADLVTIMSNRDGSGGLRIELAEELHVADAEADRQLRHFIAARRHQFDGVAVRVIDRFGLRDAVGRDHQGLVSPWMAPRERIARFHQLDDRAIGNVAMLLEAAT